MARRKTAAKEPAEKAVPVPTIEAVTLTPSLTLMPGNLATFTARRGEGVVTAQISTNFGTWTGPAANTPDNAIVSKLIETGHMFVTVQFFEDGTEFAAGTFTVEG